MEQVDIIGYDGKIKDEMIYVQPISDLEDIKSMISQSLRDFRKRPDFAMCMNPVESLSVPIDGLTADFWKGETHDILNKVQEQRLAKVETLKHVNEVLQASHSRLVLKTKNRKKKTASKPKTSSKWGKKRSLPRSSKKSAIEGLRVASGPNWQSDQNTVLSHSRPNWQSDQNTVLSEEFSVTISPDVTAAAQKLMQQARHGVGIIHQADCGDSITM